MPTFLAMVASVVVLGGCAAQQKNVFVRTDRQRMTGNAALSQQFEVDQTICSGEGRKANMNPLTGGIVGDAVRLGSQSDVVKGCMAGKGYVMVPEDQAEQRAQEFAATAAAQKPQQTPQSNTSSKGH